MILNKDIRSIIYIENKNRHTLVVTTDGEFITNESFKQVSEFLEKEALFLRSHQSFMVNTAYITRYDDKEVILSTGDNEYKVHMSRRRYKAFKEQMRR